MANRLYDTSTSKFNLSEILKTAHAQARYERRMFMAPGRETYAETFARELRAAWSDTKRRMRAEQPPVIKPIVLTEQERLAISCSYRKAA